MFDALLAEVDKTDRGTAVSQRIKNALPCRAKNKKTRRQEDKKKEKKDTCALCLYHCFQL